MVWISLLLFSIVWSPLRVLNSLIKLDAAFQSVEYKPVILIPFLIERSNLIHNFQ